MTHHPFSKPAKQRWGNSQVPNAGLGNAGALEFPPPNWDRLSCSTPRQAPEPGPGLVLANGLGK